MYVFLLVDTPSICEIVLCNSCHHFLYGMDLVVDFIFYFLFFPGTVIY